MTLVFVQCQIILFHIGVLRFHYVLTGFERVIYTVSYGLGNATEPTSQTRTVETNPDLTLVSREQMYCKYIKAFVGNTLLYWQFRIIFPSKMFSIVSLNRNIRYQTIHLG
jgi:hypothetical protein